MIGGIGSVGRLGLQGGRRLLYSQHVQEFLDRRTAADVTAGFTAGLERGVTDAFSTCIEALVAAGYLGISGGILAQSASVIKAGVPMLGAGTLSGALVPWAGDMPTPTNFNFVPGDYNRKTGLGDPANTNKYLAMNYNNNLPPQNDFHKAVRVSTAGTGATQLYMGAGGLAGDGRSHIGVTPGAQLFFRNRSNAGYDIAGAAASVGFIGSSRSVSSSFVTRSAGVSNTAVVASQAPINEDFFVFARSSSGTPISLSNARISIASVGLSLDQAIYESILATLVTSIAAAIP